MEIRVELVGEMERNGYIGYDGGDEVVEIIIWGVREFEGVYVDVVESFVVNVEGFVGVFNKLMDGEGGVVGFNNGVGNFGWWYDGEGGYYMVGEFFVDFGD